MDIDPLTGINPIGVVHNLPGALFVTYPQFLCKELADMYFETFQMCPFTAGRVAWGAEHRTVCYYADPQCPSAVFPAGHERAGELKPYWYAGKENAAHPFTDELREIKRSIEAALALQFPAEVAADPLRFTFNSCLVNSYSDGTQYIGMHSDSEKSLVKGSAIASVSLGAARWFDIEPKPCAVDKGLVREYDPDRTSAIRMEHGSMMIMAKSMQDYYKHGVRKEAKVKEQRINLTFRQSV
jgi:alkylated DNA repair dioxygenase AlkB